MPQWRPDQTFYPSPKMAMQSPPETTAFVAMLDPTRKTPDALAVVDVDPASRTYGQMVGRVDMPNPGDELHHFGWNACSSCLCPYSPQPHGLQPAAHLALRTRRHLSQRARLARGRRPWRHLHHGPGDIRSPWPLGA